MLKIARIKTAYLRGDTLYEFSRDERICGTLADPRTRNLFKIEYQGKRYTIARTKAGIAPGFLGRFRNLLYRNWTGEFRLADANDATLATAHQPALYDFTVSMGIAVFVVKPGVGQTWARMKVVDGEGRAIGELRRGPWQISGKSNWICDLPGVDPRVEILLLWLYVMSENFLESASD